MKFDTPILITGAAGLAGYWLTKALQEKGFRNLILSDFQNSENLPNIILGSISDPVFMGNLLQQTQPKIIFHLAGILGNFSSELLEEVNVKGTENLFNSLIDTKLLYSKVILVSSSAVYGDHGKKSILEKMELRPTSPYSISKIKQEEIAKHFNKNHGIEVIIARTFNNFAPREKEQMFISRIASQIVKIENGKQEKLEIGPLFSYRDYIDTRDVVNAYIELAQKGTVGETYNICSGTAVLINDLFEHLLANAKKHIIYDVVEYDQRGNIPYQVGNSDKLIETTGWSKQFDIKKTLIEILDYWRTR